jgi:pimeloyl-ACP methyl ester carboxylesterase
VAVLRSYCEGRIFGEEHGDGPRRVLLVHGWGRTHGDFDGLVARLTDAGIGSVAIDLPGFGASPALTGGGGAREYARAVAPVIDDQLVGGVVLVGHSFGGLVSLCLTDGRPDRVAALVLTGVPLRRIAPVRRPPRRYRAVRRLAEWHLVSDGRLERARQRYGSADYRAASPELRSVLVATLAESYGDEMARCRVPVTLLWGRDDREVPLEVARASVDAFGGTATVVELAGVGHFVPTERPDALFEAVKGAL